MVKLLMEIGKDRDDPDIEINKIKEKPGVREGKMKENQMFIGFRVNIKNFKY